MSVSYSREISFELKIDCGEAIENFYGCPVKWLMYCPGPDNRQRQTCELSSLLDNTSAFHTPEELFIRIGTLVPPQHENFAAQVGEPSLVELYNTFTVLGPSLADAYSVVVPKHWGKHEDISFVGACPEHFRNGCQLYDWIHQLHFDLIEDGPCCVWIYVYEGEEGLEKYDGTANHRRAVLLLYLRFSPERCENCPKPRVGIIQSQQPQ